MRRDVSMLLWLVSPFIGLALFLLLVVLGSGLLDFVLGLL